MDPQITTNGRTDEIILFRLFGVFVVKLNFKSSRHSTWIALECDVNMCRRKLAK